MSETGGEGARRTLADFALPSEPGNEREAMGRVAKVVRGLSLAPARLERLKTAVAEATMKGGRAAAVLRPSGAGAVGQRGSGHAARAWLQARLIREFVRDAQ